MTNAKTDIFVDITGLTCPVPLIKARKAIKSASKGQIIEFFGTEKEIKLGTAIARQVDAEYDINTDIDINERVESIMDRLVEVCDRKELVYTIKIIEEDKKVIIKGKGC